MPSLSYAKTGLTIVLTLKYSKLAQKYPQDFDKVKLTISKYLSEYYNLKEMKFPSSIEVTRLKVPEGTKFEVHWNNPDTDEGTQIDMKNTKCRSKEVGSIWVP